MSIYGGMFSGVSALAAQSTNFGIISDNIANVNTVGYKATRGRFETLVTESNSTKRHLPGGVIARSRASAPPPVSATPDTLWWGARKGRRVTSGASGRSSPATLAMVEASRRSAKLMGG